eukprot:4255395-Pyramimonas_sp.AAC.1
MYLAGQGPGPRPRRPGASSLGCTPRGALSWDRACAGSRPGIQTARAWMWMCSCPHPALMRGASEGGGPISD